MKSLVESVIAALILLISNSQITACSWCRAQVKENVFDDNFVGNLFILLLPVFIVAGLGFGLYHADKISSIVRRLK